MKPKSLSSFVRLLYPLILFLITLFVLPLQAAAQSQDSRSGDEAALEALAGSLEGLGTGWSTGGMSLGNTIDGVTVEAIGGELRVTRLNLKGMGLTGHIDVPAIGNLKKLTYFNTFYNNLDSEIPQELIDLPNLVYLYLNATGGYGGSNDPHIEASTGGGDVHPGKSRSSNDNHFTGAFPAPTNPANSKIEWFILNWTDTADGVADGISSIPAELFSIPTMVGLQIHDNNNIASMPFPTEIFAMTELEHLAIGTEKAGRSTGFFTGTVPAGISALSKLKFIRMRECPDLLIDFDIADFSTMTNLRVLSITFSQIRGAFPDYFVDGTMPNLTSIITSFPAGGTPGFEGAFPEVNPSMDMHIYQFRNNSLTSMSESAWTSNTKIIQPDLSDNKLMTLGSTDLTEQDRFRYLRLSGNELHENWPVLDWPTIEAEGGLDGVEFDNNRYVFKHMLYVPFNAPNGETILELYKDLSNNGSVDYAPQSPFGQSRTIYYTAGSDVTINDFDGIVSHPDNEYRWQKDGSNISGATSRSLTISEAGSADEGTYRLVVTNPGAPALTLTSEPLTLQVGDGDGGGDEVPEAPSLVSPSDGTDGVSTSPTLDWNAADGADSYRVQVSAFSDFSTTAADAGGLTATQYAVSGLNNNDTYYWRVRAANNAGSSEWSVSREFTTIEESPAAPPLVSPGDEITSVSTSPILDWEASDRADSYRVLVSADETFTDLVVDSAGISSTGFEADGLENGTTYWWKIVAENSGGSTESEAWSFSTMVQAPAAPSLSSPDDEATGQPTALTLAWNPVSGADAYQLQVATDDGFANVTVDRDAITESSQEVTGLDYSTTYYWRARASNQGGTGDWSEIRSFTTTEEPTAAPDVPTLDAPSDGATDLSTTPTLDWSAADGAETYRLQVASSSDFNTVVTDTAGLTGTEYEASLDFGTTYYWRVLTSNSGGSSDWSAARSFTTGEEPPAAPIMVSPGDETTSVSTSPTLDWETSDRADSYRVLVSADETFTDPVVDTAGISSTGFEADGLENGTTYWWKVIAENSGGTAESETWNFTTAASELSQPQLANPSDGATGQPTTLTLSWDAVDGAETYRIQVATDETFQSPVSDETGVTTTEFTVDNLESGTSYYWRVRAENADGSSSWSEIRNFTTEIQVPSAPTLASPDDEAADQPTTLTLNWDPSDQADTYRVQVSSGQDFASMVFDQGDITESSQEVSGLDNATTYYWRVRASNQAGTGSWSEVRSFTTVEQTTTPPDAPSTISPADGAGNVSLTPTLEWSDVGADSYILHLDSPETETLILEAEVSGTRYEVTEALAPDRVHKWRVRGVTDGVEGEWSPIAEFTTGSEDGGSATPPDTPTLASPADGATDLSTTPILDWSASDGAETYRLQVASSSDFSTVVTDSAGLAGTEFEASLDFGTTYHWRVLASNSDGASDWSAGWEFTTIEESPAAPTLVSPGDGVTSVSTSPALDWDPSEGTDSYRVLVSADETFTDLVVDSSGISSATSIQAEGLDNSSTYWWKIISENSGGTAESEAWSFTTLVQAPAAPSLSSPDDEATGQPTALTLAWDPVSGADAYRVQVATDDGFADVAVDRDGITESSQEVTGLDYSTTYYWRVRASNQGGTGDWSEIRSFTTTEEPTAAPDVPTLDAPSDGATGLSTTPILDWSASDGAETYRLQVASSSDFSAVVTDSPGLTGTEYEASLDFGSTYYWRVQASNSGGASDWSAARSFTTGEQSHPAVPLLLSPDDGATSVTTTPTLDWEAAARASTYRVQLSTDATFVDTHIVTDLSDVTATEWQPEVLNTDTRYFWRVQAVNGGGNSDWSEVRDFSTNNNNGNEKGPDPPGQSKPEDKEKNVPKNPNFEWQAVEADSYTIQVSNTSSGETVIDEEVYDTLFIPEQDLESNTVYQWRLKASKDGMEGEWSSMWEFTTASDDDGGDGDTMEPPGTPFLNSPSNDAQNIALMPTFDWSSVDADHYVLQVNSAESTEAVIETEVQATTFTAVEELNPETQYRWRVRAVKDGMEGEWSSEWGFTTETVEEEEMETSLGQNYPNPFNPSTQIRFTLAESQQVSLKVYDTTGRLVDTIVEETLTAGTYERTFQADNLASGVYFLRFVTENRVMTSQMTLMK